MTEHNKPKSISEKEQETLRFWKEKKIFEKSIETPAGEAPKGDFSFYDGPPFATGTPHMGHILAGTIKDAIPRYQTMRGNSVRRKWGWDCHGLPVENLIEKKLGLKSKKDIEDFGIDKFNKDAFDSVLQYEEEWKKAIPRLGRFVDMDHPYKTMDATYTESIWWAWKTLYEKGLAYEGYKMMHICPRCETTLAQSEVGMEYHDVTDLSVTAKFELVDDELAPSNVEGASPSSTSGQAKTYILAWTTTPWTLPGNTALALKGDAEYVKVKAIKKLPPVTKALDGKNSEGQEIDKQYFILAKEKFEEYKTLTKNDFSIFDIEDEFLGEKLIGKSYKPVFPYFKDAELDNKENIWKIWHADFITLDTGTGIAHEAPAFGAEDMDLAKEKNIPVIKHVKMDGTFISRVTDFAGTKVKQKDDTQSADIEIVKYLAHNGLLFEKHKIIHSYPLCWRCKTPLLNYATSSWFVDVPKMKGKLLSENQKIGWTPEHIRDGRFGKWLEGAREWAVSRSRYWGAPLPVWKSEEGDVKIVGSLKELAELNAEKPKNTYFAMRHGEAIGNVSNTIDSLGDPNNHLTEIGQEQSRHAGHFAKEQGVDVIIHSPFLRTVETAHIIKEISGAEMHEDARLRELEAGIYSAKSIHELHTLQHSGNFTFDMKLPQGESYRDVMNRVMSLLYECEKKYEGKKILFISHGSPIWLLEAGAHLRTDEELYADILSFEDTSPVFAHMIPVKPLLVPRDETGAVNLHRPYIDEIKLEIDSKTYTRIGDVFDCWFESGSMPFAQLHYPFENKEVFDKDYPADFIAEGLDQTRGWFYSLINLGVGLFDRAPYKHVIVNGLVMADTGLKLSKSEKNYTDPMELVEKYGADSIRYFLLSSPVVKGENVQFSDKEVEDVYKKVISRLENVLSLYEMNKEGRVTPKNTSSHVLDAWIVSRIHEVVAKATKGYDTYMLDEATYPIDQFVDDLSVWYVRRSRDRMKGDTGEEDRKLAYETLTYTLLMLAKVLAPVMPFTAERVYKSAGGERESVHLESWPKAGSINETILRDMKELREKVSVALMKRTASKIPVRQPLQSLTIVTLLPDTYDDIIKDEVNVKEVKRRIEGEVVTLDTIITPELQAEGDVRNLMRAIQDARKERGMTPRDTIVLLTSYDVPDNYRDDLLSTCRISLVEKGEGPHVAETSLGKISFDIR